MVVEMEASLNSDTIQDSFRWLLPVDAREMASADNQVKEEGSNAILFKPYEQSMDDEALLRKLFSCELYREEDV